MLEFYKIVKMPKRKIGGKSNKSKWRKQTSNTDLEKKMTEEVQNQLRDVGYVNRGKNAPDAKNLFKINTEPDAKVVKKLEKERFKSKKTMGIKSEYDRKKVKKIMKNIEKGENQTLNNLSSQQGDNLFDLWGEETKHVKPKKKTSSTSKHSLKNIPVPNIILPHGGQSYNPSVNDHHHLMNLVVDQNEKKEMKFERKVKKINNKKKLKAKTEKMKRHLKEMEEAKRAKKIEKEAKNIDIYFKQADKNFERKQKRLEEKRKRQSEIRKKIEKGQIQPYKRRIGLRKYELRPLEFKEQDDIDPRLLAAEASNEVILTKYDDIFRRGLLEPKRNKNKKKGYNIARVKYHTNPNYTWEEKTKEKAKFGILE